MAKNRKNETIQKKNRRLKNVKENMAKNRENETIEEKSRRLKTVKENMAKNRENETIKRKSQRKKCEKERISLKREILKHIAPDMVKVSLKFAEKVKTGPDFVCTCCHRMMYRECSFVS